MSAEKNTGQTGPKKYLEQVDMEAVKMHASRNPQEALDELYRECMVRLRCFPRWVKDGRVSATDAHDRGQRLETAYCLLRDMIAATEGGV